MKQIDINEITEQRTIPIELAKAHSKNGKNLYKPEYASIASQLVSAGFSYVDLGYAFQVSEKTIQNWKKTHPDFNAAIVEGKEGQQKRLVAKAMQGAGGYDYESSKRKIVRNNDGEIIKDEEVQFNNHQPINHNLLIWLLCNISRQLGDNDWQSKHTVELNEKRVTLKIDGSEEFKRISDFAGKYLENVKTVESKEINEKA